MIENKSLASRLRCAVIYIVVILLALCCLLPLLKFVAISLSSNAAVTGGRVGLIPVGFSAAAYEKIVADRQFWRSFGIAALRTGMALALNLVLIVLMAYPLSKSEREFKGRNVYMYLLIFAMLFNGGMIPTFLVLRRLGILNTIWALVLPGAVPMFSVILEMNFFMGIPKSLEEAALLDGASPFQVRTQIYIPCSKPSLATVALFSIVGSWNDFYSGLIYITKMRNYPLMTYIQSLSVNIEELLRAGTNAGALENILEVSNQNLNAAKIVVAVIPLLLIYPMLQKYLITGIVMGSVKE